MLKKRIVFLIGGSCASKTTTERFLKSHHGFTPVISLTSREKRPEETDGKDYFFVGKNEYKHQDIANIIPITDDWWYAVPTSQLQVPEDSNGLVYSVINVNPAVQVIRYIQENKLPLEPIAIFINPPLEDRKKCMELRGESPENINIRLSREDTTKTFVTEMEKLHVSNYTVDTRSLNPNTQSDIAEYVWNCQVTYTKDEMISALWQIIDDIDTASDIAKSDNELYRSMVEKLQSLRWQLPIETDGNKLIVKSQPKSPTNYDEYQMDTYVSLTPNWDNKNGNKLGNKHTPREALVIESLLSLLHGSANVTVTQNINTMEKVK